MTSFDSSDQMGFGEAEYLVQQSAPNETLLSFEYTSQSIVQMDTFFEDLTAPERVNQKSEETILRELLCKKLGKRSVPKKKKKVWDKVFLLFHTKANKSPKKEFERQKVIRGHKNILRHLYDNDFPSRHLVAFDKTNRKLLSLWEDLRFVFKNHQVSLSKLAQTVSGPLTDGKNLRNGNKKGKEKTCNDSFIRNYFSSEGVKESWGIYIDFLFSEADCDTLCKKFKIYCCDGRHTFECEDSWECLKKYLKFGILSTLSSQKYEIEDYI